MGAKDANVSVVKKDGTPVPGPIILSEDNARRMFETIARIYSEKYGCKITAHVRKKEIGYEQGE